MRGSKRKADVESNAMRITVWLLDHRTDFEGAGVSEDSVLASGVAPGAQEAREAIDHLESREDLVRWPHALSSPPAVILKAGRNWPATREKISSAKA